ncbi:MAG: WD40/YVTN/BNR-like repeat-containing protein [Panacagrimonas sp.]
MRSDMPFKMVLNAGLIVLCAGAVGPVSAAAPIEVVHSGTMHQALFAIAFDGDSGIAVGAAGEAQTTQDGGKTWKQSKLPTEFSLLGVHTDSARSLAVGQTGTVVLKEGGGQWAKVESGTQKRLFAVESNSEGLAVAVGEFGALQLSEDGGKSWHSLSLDWNQIGTDGGAEPHLYGVDIGSKGAITVTGEFGLVLRSADHGRNWTVQSKGTASVFAVKIRDDGIGFAVGQDGYALKTTDYGVNWTCIDLGSKAILNGVHSSADGKVVVTAMREMIVSDDDGASWKSVNDPKVTTVWYVGVGASNQAVIAVGQSGNIIRVGS